MSGIRIQKSGVVKMSENNKIIELDKSIIPACDVSSIEELKELVMETSKIQKLGAYKIGFELVIPYGMKNVVDTIREFTNKPIIYDHQKAGTDVPFTGEKFARVCKESGVDAVIFFPLAGPVTMTQWVKAAKSAGLGVIIGGEMTHESFLKSGQGYIIDEAPRLIYNLAVELGVTDFVVPGTKPDKIRQYKEIIVGAGCAEPVFYSPGLVEQGGKIGAAASAAGERWHAIVGRALYQAKDKKAAALELCKELN